MRPAEPAPTRLDAERYFALVARGDIRPDDRVELLEGVVVSMSPQGSPHANAIARITAVLVPMVGSRGIVRVQCSFRAGRYNVPEPDFAIVPGPLERWEHEHPDQAFVIIEVADSSLPTDRAEQGGDLRRRGSTAVPGREPARRADRDLQRARPGSRALGRGPARRAWRGHPAGGVARTLARRERHVAAALTCVGEASTLIRRGPATRGSLPAAAAACRRRPPARARFRRRRSPRRRARSRRPA